MTGPQAAREAESRRAGQITAPARGNFSASCVRIRVGPWEAASSERPRWRPLETKMGSCSEESRIDICSLSLPIPVVSGLCHPNAPTHYAFLCQAALGDWPRPRSWWVSRSTLLSPKTETSYSGAPPLQCLTFYLLNPAAGRRYFTHRLFKWATL